MDKKEFRDFAVKGQNINGNTFDQYTGHVENMTRAVIEEGLPTLEKLTFFQG